METIFKLSFLFVHEGFADCGAVVYDSISCILDISFLFFGQTLIIGDIQMSNLGCLLGTILPNVRSQNLSTGSENNMSSGVMSLELLSSLSVDCDVDLLSLVELEVALQWSVKSMKYAFAYFNGINDLV